ncbi:hypothetical protein PG987_015231 [Apiospora arundinis]
MVALKVVRAANVALTDSPAFVAAFFGGTAGIGKMAVTELAKTFADHGDALSIYIVGRNQEAAQRIIGQCKDLCPAGNFQFVGGDMCLMKDTDRVCAEITRQEVDISSRKGRKAKIDLLVLSQGELYFGSRIKTEEGLDKSWALSYYSRMRAALQLLPLLREASARGGRVVSVLNPKLQKTLHTNDLLLNQPGNYGLSSAISHAAHMTSFFMEELARRNPGRLSLCHYFPGLVDTDLIKKSPVPGWVSFIWLWILRPLSWWRFVPSDECGQRILYMASSPYYPPGESSNETTVDGAVSKIATGSDGKAGSGSYRVDWDGEIFANTAALKKLHKEEAGQKVWDHTMSAFSAIEAGDRYEG